MAQVLKLDHVTVRRSGKTILNDVTWEVDDSQRWVVLGPNGAGKTTVVQLASARMYPTTGTVDVLGERLGAVDISELRTRVGLASSALADRIDPAERALDVVRTAAWGMTGRWREEYDEFDTQRAADLLAAFGMSDFAHRRFGTLSEGERKRVQVARSLMSDPELLILDEPASGLDLGGRELLLAALTEIATDPASPVMVLVTHHVEEIPTAFTHALLLRAGGVVAAGPLPEVMTDANLTTTFGLPIQVTGDAGRYTARAAG